jgi:FkbM family methyltransferase
MAQFSHSTSLDPSEVFFLDIGANLGTYSVSIAAEGYRVIAFEGMKTNQEAIKLSACANGLQDRLHVIEYGVGREDSTCQIYQHQTNAQNGVVGCDGVAPLDDFVPVSEIRLDSIDNLLKSSFSRLVGKVGVIKIDVEGFEPQVIEGGREFFRVVQPAMIVTEINSGTLSKVANCSEMDYVRQVREW